ncbi:MAG: hypothetical protein WC455_27810 [Dehalococcoidia bacterium]|jgi:hypothetical protein
MTTETTLFSGHEADVAATEEIFPGPIPPSWLSFGSPEAEKEAFATLFGFEK